MELVVRKSKLMVVIRWIIQGDYLFKLLGLHIPLDSQQVHN